MIIEMTKPIMRYEYAAIPSPPSNPLYTISPTPPNALKVHKRQNAQKIAIRTPNIIFCTDAFVDFDCAVPFVPFKFNLLIYNILIILILLNTKQAKNKLLLLNYYE